VEIQGLQIGRENMLQVLNKEQAQQTYIKMVNKQAIKGEVSLT
jgi:hypothetical protein